MITAIDRECLNKRMFDSEDEALRTGRGAFTGFTLRAYKCPHCGFWHLTKSAKAEGGAQ